MVGRAARSRWLNKSLDFANLYAGIVLLLLVCRIFRRTYHLTVGPFEKLYVAVVLHCSRQPTLSPDAGGVAQERSTGI